VTQQDEGDFCHLRNHKPYFRPIVYVDNAKRTLNKPYIFTFLMWSERNRRYKEKVDVSGRQQAMGFPGTWMTESESLVYRVVPKCACSTIGQILYYSDHEKFFDGDIHDAQEGLHKWALEDSQPLINANVKTQNSYAFTCVRKPNTRAL